MNKLSIIILSITCCTQYTHSMEEQKVNPLQHKLDLHIKRWNRETQELEQNGLKELEARAASPEEIKKFQEMIKIRKNTIQKIAGQ